jgi:hypothetical protein
MLMTMAFTLNVSYSQVAVFDSSLSQPFNFWTDKHVAQGFAWRPGSVSFCTLAEAGPHSVEVLVTSAEVEVSSDAIRVIQVPFEVPATGAIEVASIADSVPLSIPSQMYALRFECLRPNSESDIKFVFTAIPAPKFQVLRSDLPLVATDDLLLIASPA